MRILLIELGLATDALMLDGFQSIAQSVSVLKSHDVSDRSIKSQAYDLVVLDLGYCEHDIRFIVDTIKRPNPRVAILAVVSTIGPAARVRRLNEGADDCMSRPYDADELRARAKALVRQGIEDSVQIGNLVWDWEQRQGRVNAAPLPLSRTETRIFETLLRSPNHVVSMERLARSVDAEGTSDSNNKVYVYVCRLRKKLASAQIEVRSCSGVGYSLAVSQSAAAHA
jgi:DNA-binding response OmpR family regulator